MMKRELFGQPMREFVQERINHDSEAMLSSLTQLEAMSATKAWLATLRAVEEFINLWMFGIDDEHTMRAVAGVRIDPLSPLAG
jgi:hypothetical protein